MLMMKGLLLLNVNNTVWHTLCLSKRRPKEVKMGQKSYPKGGLTKNGSNRRSKTRVKDQRELLILRGNP